MKKIKNIALCNRCYDGEIVEDPLVPGHFFCNRCFRTFEIRKFRGEKNAKNIKFIN